MEEGGHRKEARWYSLRTFVDSVLVRTGYDQPSTCCFLLSAKGVCRCQGFGKPKSCCENQAYTTHQE